MWSRDGRELFYIGSDNRIMIAAYAAIGDSFEASKLRPWSSTPISGEVDLAPDGKRFVEARPRGDPPGDSARSVQVTFLLNFFDQVRRRLSTGR